MSLSDAEKLLARTLKEAEFSITMARKTVFSALEGKEPQTMHELVESVRPTVDRASVYRVIDLFEKLHITERINLGWKYKIELGDMFNLHHHHIICEKCGRIDDLQENVQIEKILLTASKKLGYDLHVHQVELRGICRTCQTL